MRDTFRTLSFGQKSPVQTAGAVRASLARMNNLAERITQNRFGTKNVASQRWRGSTTQA